LGDGRRRDGNLRDFRRLWRGDTDRSQSDTRWNGEVLFGGGEASLIPLITNCSISFEVRRTSACLGGTEAEVTGRASWSGRAVTEVRAEEELLEFRWIADPGGAGSVARAAGAR
uniref:VASt domain-containing protein n=1 Tax=Rodentolepis nana TaxID=102285 RepID=A0A158QGS3_RODNA